MPIRASFEDKAYKETKELTREPIVFAQKYHMWYHRRKQGLQAYKQPHTTKHRDKS